MGFNSGFKGLRENASVGIPKGEYNVKTVQTPGPFTS